MGNDPNGPLPRTETRCPPRLAGYIVEEVDEIEIFSGIENTLIMQQTYTHTFQCIYQLTKYPFDTQVSNMLHS